MKFGHGLYYTVSLFYIGYVYGLLGIPIKLDFQQAHNTVKRRVNDPTAVGGLYIRECTPWVTQHCIFLRDGNKEYYQVNIKQ